MTRKNLISRCEALKGAFAIVTAGSLAGGKPGASDEGPHATLQRTNEMAWKPLDSPFFPSGLMVKEILTNQKENTSLSLVRYPKGYVEPRHYHKACGHWLYFLNGRMRDGSKIYAPGTFIYSPPLNVHGPFTAELETDVLFFVDGPFDVFGVEDRGQPGMGG